MENPIKMDDLGVFPLFLVQHPYKWLLSKLGGWIQVLEPLLSGSVGRNVETPRLEINFLSIWYPPWYKWVSMEEKLKYKIQIWYPLWYYF